MSGNNGAGGCARTSWIVAAIVGAIAFVLLIAAADWRVLTALIAGVLLFAILGFLFNRLLCSESAVGVERAPGRPPAPSPSPKPAPPAPAPTATPEAAVVPPPASEAAPEPVRAEVPDADVQETVRPTAHLAGEADLAERKGSWTYTAPEADAAEIPEPVAEPAAAPAPEPAPEPEPEPVRAPTAAEPEAPRVQPSTVLAGEAELASRKGSWRYTPPATPSGEDYDGDGIFEGTDEGEKPAMLDGPRGGVADDLKQVKGIGPKLEKLCNRLGIYHFDQIAAWTDQEIAWVDANLEGFKGRVSRDAWVAQARVLSEGGQTDFSARVKDGNVY